MKEEETMKEETKKDEPLPYLRKRLMALRDDAFYLYNTGGWTDQTTTDRHLREICEQLRVSNEISAIRGLVEIKRLRVEEKREEAEDLERERQALLNERRAER